MRVQTPVPAFDVPTPEGAAWRAGLCPRLLCPCMVHTAAKVDSLAHPIHQKIPIHARAEALQV